MERLEKVKRMALCMQRYSWEQGVVAQAFLEDGDEETAILLAREAAHRQLPDGRPAIIGDTNAVTDPCSIGEVLRFAYEKTGDSVFSDALEMLLLWAKKDAPRTNNGILYHITQRPEIWVDSFYMLPPYLAAVGEFDEAVRQCDGLWSALFRPEKGLLGHIRNMDTGGWVRDAIWSTGNGWALSGLARVVDYLPESRAEGKLRLIGYIKTLLDNALPLMREDGLFHDVLDDSTTFREVNFPQMMAYTIYRGVAGGWLPREMIPYAVRMREAANRQVDAYGLVTEVCGAPEFGQSGESAEGQAFFILMEAAARSFEARGKG